jgi:hypothetical protein
VLYGAFYPNYYVGEFADKREFQSLDRNTWNRENIDPFRSILVSGLPHDVYEGKVQVLTNLSSRERFSDGNVGAL